MDTIMCEKSCMATHEWGAPISAVMAFTTRASRPTKANLWRP